MSNTSYLLATSDFDTVNNLYKSMSVWVCAYVCMNVYVCVYTYIHISNKQAIINIFASLWAPLQLHPSPSAQKVVTILKFF